MVRVEIGRIADPAHRDAPVRPSKVKDVSRMFLELRVV
jgi:hypothetical protein